MSKPEDFYWGDLAKTLNKLKDLVIDAVEWDRKENFNKAPSQRCDYHLQSLV